MLAAACSSGGSDGGPSSDPGASPGEPSGTLRLFSYSDGFDPDYMATFYQEYPDINLETASFGSNDEAIAKLQAGFQADVINSCVDEATLEMVNKGLYAPLDVSRLENWDDIWPSMKALPGVQVDGKVYLVPADAGTAGIMYNADVVTTPPDSWLDLFDPQWAGRASMEDVSVTAIDIGALALGISDPLKMTSDQLEQVKNFLIDHRGQFRTFWKGDADVKSQFKSGEIVDLVRLPGRCESSAQGGRERAVRGGQGGPDAVDVRVRHQSGRAEPRCGLCAAQLVLEPAAADLRRDELQLHHLEHGSSPIRCHRRWSRTPAWTRSERRRTRSPRVRRTTVTRGSQRGPR